MSNAKYKYKGRQSINGSVTTSYVANLFGVASRTVAGWADSGLLKHYRLVSNHRGDQSNRQRPNHDGERRFFIKDVIAFAKAHNIPMPRGLIQESSVLAFNIETDWEYHIPLDKLLPNVKTAKNPFEFGSYITSPDVTDIPLALIGDYNGSSIAFQATEALIKRYSSVVIHMFLHSPITYPVNVEPGKLEQYLNPHQTAKIHFHTYPLNYDKLVIDLYRDAPLTQLNSNNGTGINA